MLYYDFKDYEEFKQIFGIIEHGNGVKSRNNKILLALYKDRDALRLHMKHREFRSIQAEVQRLDRRRYNSINHNHLGFNKIVILKYEMVELLDKFSGAEQSFTLLECKSLQTLRSELFLILQTSLLRVDGCFEMLHLNNRFFFSDLYRTDDMEGLCEDGTLNAIRYYNLEKGRVFKMKAGKMFNHILSRNVITNKLPEQIHRWLGEEFVADWIDYARENIGETEYTLHVDDNFEDIYSTECCAGYDTDNDSFGSCMMDDGQWYFYRQAVKARAAYLTDSDNMIVARCVIFTDVHEVDSDKVWRLAERQYSRGCDNTLKRQLVCALIKGGYIDGYKRVGSSCHDSRAYVDNEGNSLESKRFWIDCRLHDGDDLSYQDSFKYYDEDEERADNYGYGRMCLDTTDSSFSSESEEDEDSYRYSSYNGEDIPEDEAYYVETRDDYFYDYQTCEANVWSSFNDRFFTETCFSDDCVEINGEMYYAGPDCDEPEDHGLARCPYCDEIFVPGEGNAVYSDVTEEDYCCCDCLVEAEREWHRDNGDTYSDYDGEWYENAEDVITAYEWCHSRYYETTISVESFNDRVEEGTATEFCGVYYLDKVSYDGEPKHIWQGQLNVA